MKTDLRNSLLVKVCALFLISLLSAGAFFCAFGVIYLDSGGAYEKEGSYYNTEVCHSISYELMHTVYYQWADDPSGSWQAAYTPENSNFGFEIFRVDAPETALLRVNVPERVGSDRTMYIDDYLVRGYVSAAMTAQDQYSYSYGLYQQLLPYNWFLIWGFIAACVVALALLIFLCCAAGHRWGETQVLPNYLDRMPLDLWLALAIAGGAFCLAALDPYDFALTPFHLLLGGAGLLGVFLLTLATILTFATRVKLGKWWRNTIIYKLLRLALRMLRGIWHALTGMLQALPLIWQAVLLLTAFAFFQSLLSYSAQYSGMGFLLLLTLDLGALFFVSQSALSLRRLQEGGARLAGGYPEYRVDTRRMPRVLREHGENLNSIGGGIAIAVDQRMKSERMKTELITNVSHDIKTPLTSILNYVDLLQKNPTPDEQAEYLAVLDRQARRLKKLTEDLVEASKAATGNLQVTLERTDPCELLRQAAGEYAERLTAGGLTPVLTVPEEELCILADGRLLWRVIDNLLSNSCKYAQPGTRVYLDARRVEEHIVLSVRNISRQQLNIAPDELMERFVRGDSARNTEGSGLGLNIAKSLTELQGGRLEILIDGDLFKATLSFPSVS